MVASEFWTNKTFFYCFKIIEKSLDIVMIVIFNVMHGPKRIQVCNMILTIDPECNDNILFLVVGAHVKSNTKMFPS